MRFYIYKINLNDNIINKKINVEKIITKKKILY